ncbi:hypothetical protein F25303_9067 [Fusarium sp. NRRL 25303]|nr:hypothetical protein F25303_9067 [Fusarium sp. NRRL 25303]
MNGTQREPLSSECIIKCIVDAYAYEGDALFVQMTRKRLPKYGWGASMPCRSVCPDDSGGYEFVVIGLWKYESLLRDHVAIESPRSGGPSHDKCALEAFSELQLAGYEVLAWRPYCKEARPYMDRDGNTLPIEERPPLKSLDELEDTGEDNTIEGIQLRMSNSEDTSSYYDSEERRRSQLQLYRGIVRENVEELIFLQRKVKDLEVTNSIGWKDPDLAELLEVLLDKMALSAERRRSKYFELKAVMLQKEIDKTDRFTDFEMVFDSHKDEKDRNGQSHRLVEIDSNLYDAWDRVKMADRANGRAMVEMDAAELNLLGGVRDSPEI